MFYKNFGYSISSDVELPFVISNEITNPDIKISNLLCKPELIGPTQEYFVNVTHTEKLICKVKEHRNMLVMDFEEHICFQYIKTNDKYALRYYCYKPFTKDIIGRLVGRFGLTYLLTWMGMTVLHGSAVSNSREAICFVADSGVGKSSMAGLFIAEGYRLVSDELIVLKLEDNNAIILPSSSYLYLSENSYQKVSLSQFPSIPSLVQFRNDYKEKLETKICVDLKSVCTSKPINCKKIIILNRNEQNKVSLSKYKKLEAYMKLIYYLYTPIVFPFMRKNLSAIMNFIETEQIFFSDCFSQFTDIKQHVEEN